ncbi:13630_t:CDS:1, partial [Ambispora leptoticha]
MVSPDSHPGRLPFLKANDRCQFIRTAVANRKNSVKKTIEKFNYLGLNEISMKTARHILHEHGYFGH